MSGNGFGDSLNVEEVLARKEALLQIMVSENTAVTPEMRDDVLQEARITAWQVYTSDREMQNRDTYTHAAARKRIGEVAQRQTWTGHTRVHGQPTDPLRQQGKESLDVMIESDSGLALVAVELLDGVEVAYHYGQVHQAIRALSEPHRLFVYQKYWLGLSESELAAKHGKSVGTISRWWTQTIKPALRQNLEHLVNI